MYILNRKSNDKKYKTFIIDNRIVNTQRVRISVLNSREFIFRCHL